MVTDKDTTLVQHHSKLAYVTTRCCKVFQKTLYFTALRKTIQVSLIGTDVQTPQDKYQS
jgi:hypothetical protein